MGRGREDRFFAGGLGISIFIMFVEVSVVLRVVFDFGFGVDV